jgi:hypothetical protein
MIYIEYVNSVLTLDGSDYSITSLEKCSESGVFVGLHNDVNDFIYRLNAYTTTINGVLQTSADMIIQTLSD